MPFMNFGSQLNGFAASGSQLNGFAAREDSKKANKIRLETHIICNVLFHSIF